MPQVSSNRWESGRMLASRQEESSGMMSPAASICEVRLAWVIMHPLGLPVVPEVKKMAASSSEGRCQPSPPVGAMGWGAMDWGAMGWGAMDWGAMGWGAVTWGAVTWGAMNCAPTGSDAVGAR